MFETINPPAAPVAKQLVTLAASVVAHVAVVSVLIIVPFLYVTEQLPEPPDMFAFVVTSAPPPPPPPPPPAAPQVRQAVKPMTPRATDPVSVTAAPVEAPRSISPERLPDVPEQMFVPGGVEGGIVGGIAGGIAGGIPFMPAPPPPPPPAPVRPVRVGGEIKEPTLLHRVNPEYPLLAISAKREGMVILEATVDTEGQVREVRVLRSEPLLDKAAVEAVKQWRYSPLHLNGERYPFVLTVTVSFNL